MKKIQIWHGTAVESMEDFAGDLVQHYMLEELAAQGCAWTSRVVLRM